MNQTPTEPTPMTQTVPTPEQISALTGEQVEAVDQAWWQVRNTEEYLSGRGVVTRAAGYEPRDLGELVEADANLAALKQAVTDRFGGIRVEMKGLDSSARWAYLAHTHGEGLSDAQREALLAGWNAATAPSKPQDYSRTYWVLSLTAMAFLVLNAAFAGVAVGPTMRISWPLVAGAVLMSLAMIVVWVRSGNALKQGRTSSHRLALTILAALQVANASYWFAVTDLASAPAPQVAGAVIFIGLPPIAAALLFIAALDPLARHLRAAGAPTFTEPTDAAQ